MFQSFNGALGSAWRQPGSLHSMFCSVQQQPLHSSHTTHSTCLLAASASACRAAARAALSTAAVSVHSCRAAARRSRSSAAAFSCTASCCRCASKAAAPSSAAACPKRNCFAVAVELMFQSRAKSWEVRQE